jgi:hypothetical protein
MENNHHQILSGITVKSPKVGWLFHRLQHGISASSVAQTYPERLKAIAPGVLA